MMDGGAETGLSSSMDGILRRCAALAAAYAVALQGLLASFALVLPAGAAAPAFAICRSAPDSPPQAPLSHNACLACLAGHCSGSAADDPRVALAIFVPIAIGLSKGPVAPLHAAPFAPRTFQHAPRAPPHVI